MGILVRLFLIKGIVNSSLNNGYAEIIWGIPWLNINWKEY